jgi:hypothetical protein
MRRIVFSAALALACSAIAYAQAPPAKTAAPPPAGAPAPPVAVAKDGQYVPVTEVVTRLEVSAAAAPVPALKFQLLPEVRELHPGNPAHGYLKCFMEQDNLFARKESQDEREKLMTRPLDELQGKSKNYGGSAVTHAKYAARLETVDWGVLALYRRDGYMTLLPDIQKLRALAAVLIVRARVEIADGNFPEAIECIKTVFAISHHLGEHPTLIGTLVGLAIHNLGMKVTEELIARPKAPNLYWALTFYPQPCVGLHKALTSEPMGLETHFGALLNPKHPWSKSEIREAQESLRVLADIIGIGEPSKRAKYDEYLKSRLSDAAWLKQAREFLATLGYEPEKLAEYPPEQVVIYYLLRKTLINIDDLQKYGMLPYAQFEKFYVDPKPTNLEEEITRSVLPALSKVKLAQARQDQRMAVVRGIEMVRLYAAANNGKLPADLEATKLPIPTDPMTGGPIRYEVKGDTAILRGTPPKGFEKSVYNYWFEVTIRK